MHPLIAIPPHEYHTCHTQEATTKLTAAQSDRERLAREAATLRSTLQQAQLRQLHATRKTTTIKQQQGQKQQQQQQQKIGAERNMGGNDKENARQGVVRMKNGGGGEYGKPPRPNVPLQVCGVAVV